VLLILKSYGKGPCVLEGEVQQRKKEKRPVIEKAEIKTEK